MDILIHIPSEDIPTKQDMIDVSLHFIDGHVSSCTYPFEELESNKHYVYREDVENNIFRMMCDKEYSERFHDSIDDVHSLARAIVRMLYSLQTDSEIGD